MRIPYVFAVLNRKGGVGKTTTAVNLAYGLATLAKPLQKVLLIDLDPQGSVLQSFGLNPTRPVTLADVLVGSARAEDAIIYNAKLPQTLAIIPSNDTLIDAKVRILANEVATNMASSISGRAGIGIKTQIHLTLTKSLGHLNRQFDFIILDCPPSLDYLSNAVYKYADFAIVPVKPDYLGSAGTVMHTRNLLAAQAEGYEIQIECFLPTFYRKRETLAQLMLEELIKTYGANKVATPIPQAAAIEQAPALNGQTIFQHAPKSPAALAYKDLVFRILEKYRYA